MEQRANDLLLAGIDRQIKEASPIIAECLRKGNDCELRVDCYGHLKLVEIRKKSLNYR